MFAKTLFLMHRKLKCSRCRCWKPELEFVSQSEYVSAAAFTP